MKPNVFAALTSAFLMSSSAVAEITDVQDLQAIQPETISSARVEITETGRGPEGPILVDVIATAVYSNSCLVTDQKLKKFSQKGNEFHYEIWGTVTEDKLCPKVFLPVERSYRIDRFELKSRQDMPQIFVNQSPL
jgi:hypothetical protein